MAVEFDENEPDPSQENEEDLTTEVTQAVLKSTDWTIGTLLDQMRRGRINLNPRFQRREAWTDPRKSEFIESLLLNLPIPQIVLAESRENRGSFLVIDGKQRLTALRRFGASADDPDPALSPLRLQGLKVRADLNGETWESLSETPRHREDIDFLENQTLRTIVVTNWSDDDLLHRIFLRLNTNTVSLSPQELRQALHPGPFVDWVDQASDDSKALRKLFNNDHPDFRMRDDETCDYLNERWIEHADEITSDYLSLESAVDCTFKVFREGAFYRWNGSRFDRRFNRSIFDIMLYYFRLDSVAEAARAEATEVVKAFKFLCESDSEFLRSVQTTTKTVKATHYRLATWGSALDSVLPVTVPIPRLKGTKNVRIEPVA